MNSSFLGPAGVPVINEQLVSPIVERQLKMSRYVTKSLARQKTDNLLTNLEDHYYRHMQTPQLQSGNDDFILTEEDDNPRAKMLV